MEGWWLMAEGGFEGMVFSYLIIGIDEQALL